MALGEGFLAGAADAEGVDQGEPLVEGGVFPGGGGGRGVERGDGLPAPVADGSGQT